MRHAVLQLGTPCNCAVPAGLAVASINGCIIYLILPPHTHRYLKCDLLQYNLSNLGSRFDVICIDPPLEEYTRRYSGFQFHQHMWDFEEVGTGHWRGGG